MEIGHSIRRLRIKNGLTLTELASRCELTKGFLSQLENEITSPSISTLEDILEALGSSLGEFFKEPKNSKNVFKEDDFFLDEKDEYTISWIIPNAQKRKMEPLLIELKENGKSFLMEPHEGEEFGYVLQGKIKIVYEDESEEIVHTGETFYLDGLEQHHLENISKKKSQVLWITTPPSF
ncbi:MAG: XRE family transcriptional regulator [Bacilli bacterium]|nr:XRE family transcriptional regulator [Bacilli bacterium]